MYKASWSSLRNHPTPQWFRDAKFGIYTHWGIYSVPACGPNVSWYPYNMYREGTPQHQFHVKTYGPPSRFGYKDFIPMFRGERFDPEEWAHLFKEAGARFAGPVGEHHDGFAMWDSRHSEWTAAKMGPKQDVVGKLERAIRGAGMRFLVALHHAENWWFFPHWRKELDTAEPKFAGLYGEAHDVELSQEAYREPDISKLWPRLKRPSDAFLRRWLDKTGEVIEKYQPDLLWFDFGIGYVQEHYRQEMLARYYTWAESKGKEVAATYKWHNLVPGSAVIDLELGRFSEMAYQDWLTDTTVDAGQGWGYMRDTGYKGPAELIHYLVDNVSKNGAMLLNVGPKPNGEIPEQARILLRAIGKWLSVNGEAIFETTPWTVFGEGPARVERGGPFNEDQRIEYSASDIRFTARDDALYAICMGEPKEELIITAVAANLYPSEIKSVWMLGSPAPVKWEFRPDGLRVVPPSELPCEHAVVFKIERHRPRELERRSG